MSIRKLAPNDEVHLDSTRVVAGFFQYSALYQYSIEGVAQPESPKAGESGATKEIVSLDLCNHVLLAGISEHRTGKCSLQSEGLKPGFAAHK